MCSDPQSNSFAPTGKVACRKCNECITAYKNDWVARSMAEKATMGNALVLMLSYPNNPDGTLPDSARAFKYKDVQDFMKRLRKAYKAKYNATGEISYIVAGELGSKRKRVHWHMILFSKRSLHDLGEWTTLKGKAMDGPKITEKGWNQHWSIWSDFHGYVCPQVPDQGGVAYVLKYAMKDQFNVVKSEGTARFTKSERHAAGMFRMSKQPAIGWRYLQEKIDDWDERGCVPTDLLVKIPGYSGYYWPKGKTREAALKALHDINHMIREEKGRDAPQWDALLHSVAARDADHSLLLLRQKQGEWEREQWKLSPQYAEQSRKDREFQRSGGARRNSDALRKSLGLEPVDTDLGPWSDPRPTEDVRTFSERFAAKERRNEFALRAQWRADVEHCRYGFHICQHCEDALTEEARGHYERYQERYTELWRRNGSPGRVYEWYRSLNRENPFGGTCPGYFDPARLRSFASDGARKGEKKVPQGKPAGPRESGPRQRGGSAPPKPGVRPVVSKVEINA